MLTGLTLGETPLSPAPGASSLPPASTKKPLKDGKQGKPRRAKKGEKTVDKKQEMREALMDFVIRVARNQGGKNTEAEVAALPQIADILFKNPSVRRSPI